jgi:hypothetical protein
MFRRQPRAIFRGVTPEDHLMYESSVRTSQGPMSPLHRPGYACYCGEQSVFISRIKQNAFLNIVGRMRCMNADVGGTYIYHCDLNS